MKEKIERFFEKKENLYIVLAFGFGLLMALLNPPFAGVPDEHAHYWKAWSIAEGQLQCSGKDAIPATAAALPDAIKPVINKAFEGKKIIVNKLRIYLGQADNNETTVIGGANCPATPFGYIPQVIGLRLGKIFNAPALVDFYLARILSLLAAAFLVYWAIRVVPFGKMIFVVIGLLPMTIRQFSSMSYDALQIAFAMLFLAYILKFAVEKTKLLTRNNALFLAALSLFGLNIKAGYFVLSFLVFLFPFSKFKDRKKYWLFTISFVVISVAFFLLMRNVFVDTAIPTWTNPAQQMKYVISNPFNFVNISLESFYGSKGFFPFMESIFFKVGTGESLSYWVYVLIFFGFIVFLKNNDEEVDLSAKQRWIMFLVFLANFFLIYLALYVGWTTVGADHVSGVQGRYFLVILPLLIFAFYKAKLNFKCDFIKKHMSVIFAAFLMVIFLASFFAIYQAYYQKVPKVQDTSEVKIKEGKTVNN